MQLNMQAALLDIFKRMWDYANEGFTEDLEDIMANSPLIEKHIATEADIENGDAPEGCEVDEWYYRLSPLGKDAWELHWKLKQ